MIHTGVNGEKYFIYGLGESMHQCHAQILRIALENNNWNRTHAAKALGLSLGTVKNWIRIHGIVRPEQDEDH